MENSPYGLGYTALCTDVADPVWYSIMLEQESTLEPVELSMDGVVSLRVLKALTLARHADRIHFGDMIVPSSLQN